PLLNRVPGERSDWAVRTPTGDRYRALRALEQNRRKGIGDMSQRAHVLILSSKGRVAKRFTAAAVKALAPNQTPVGRSDHFVIYSDGSADGDASAQAVQQTAEADYTATRAWFSNIDVPPGDGSQGNDRTGLPIQVLEDPQAGGAYHFGCAATDIYIQPEAKLASGLMVAELVEVFEAVQNKGWDCGHVNGEALSRVLANERNPALGDLLAQTGRDWWANGRADYISSNDADDQNQDANGCGSLFLYYLHSQLNFS